MKTKPNKDGEIKTKKENVRKVKKSKEKEE